MKLPLMMRNALRGEMTAKNSNGSPIVVFSTEPHELFLKPMILHLGLTQTMECRRIA